MAVSPFFCGMIMLDSKVSRVMIFLMNQLVIEALVDGVHSALQVVGARRNHNEGEMNWVLWGMVDDKPCECILYRASPSSVTDTEAALRLDAQDGRYIARAHYLVPGEDTQIEVAAQILLRAANDYVTDSERFVEVIRGDGFPLYYISMAYAGLHEKMSLMQAAHHQWLVASINERYRRLYL